MFKTIVDGTLCPFAPNAAWNELVTDAATPLPERALELAEQLRALIPAAEEQGRDMFAVEITDPRASSDIRAFTRFIAAVLSRVSDDPRSIGDDSVMLQHGWRYWVGGVQCFTLTFAPFYAANHPRFSPTGSAYLVFQFESSFERNNVTTMTPAQLAKLSHAVRTRFEEHGINYLAEVTHGAPESLHVIKPERACDPPIHWWKPDQPPAERSEPRDYFEILDTDGYVVFDRSLPDRRWFESIYQLYDDFVDGLTPESSAELRQSALAWLQTKNMYNYYCGAPAGFRDRHGMSGKRDKSYLQWCRPFARSAEFTATVAAGTDAMQKLCRRLDYLESVCARLFQGVLDDIGQRYPDYLSRYDPERPLPIIIKMLRYNRNPSQFATDPHNDKSALSLILHADDSSVRWRIGRGKNCPLSAMVAPFAYPESPTASNHSVLFSGLCLEDAGVELPPTPHFVMPVERGDYRHSVVAFLLTPDLPSTATMSTQASFVHDIMENIQ